MPTNDESTVASRPTSKDHNSRKISTKFRYDINNIKNSGQIHLSLLIIFDWHIKLIGFTYTVNSIHTNGCVNQIDGFHKLLAINY